MEELRTANSSRTNKLDMGSFMRGNGEMVFKIGMFKYYCSIYLLHIYIYIKKNINDILHTLISFHFSHLADSIGFWPDIC